MNWINKTRYGHYLTSEWRKSNSQLSLWLHCQQEKLWLYHCPSSFNHPKIIQPGMCNLKALQSVEDACWAGRLLTGYGWLPKGSHWALVDLILMCSQSVSLGLLQFHMCSKKLVLWEWCTVKKMSMVEAWCVHGCHVNFKIWYVFLGITLFSLTYPFLGRRWGGGDMPEGLKKITDPVIFLKSLGPLS